MDPVVYQPQPITPATVQPAPVLPRAHPVPAPVPGRDIPTVVIAPDGRPYYGYPPIVYPAPRRVGIDPIAQRLVGVGVAAAGAGWGIGEVVSALAGATSSAVVVAAAVALWKVLPSGSRPVVNSRVETHHHTTAHGMFSRAGSRVDHNRLTGGR